MILEERNTILGTVKKCIVENLNPKKCNIIDPRRENYVNVPSITEILQELEILKLEFYEALSISNDDDFHIHLKRELDACFINRYFVEGLQAWKANIGIRPVFNHYKPVTYMFPYFSKAEDEKSETMKQAAEEALVSGKSNFEKMRAVARAYSTKRVFQRNMLDRYLDRTDREFQNGKFAVIDSKCLAEFLSFYYLQSKSKPELHNDSKPVVLDDELMETNHLDFQLIRTIPLMSSKEKLKCRKVKAVLRYYVPNANRNAEEYAHNLLFSFYPFLA